MSTSFSTTHSNPNKTHIHKKKNNIPLASSTIITELYASPHKNSSNRNISTETHLNISILIRINIQNVNDMTPNIGDEKQPQQNTKFSHCVTCHWSSRSIRVRPLFQDDTKGRHHSIENDCFQCDDGVIWGSMLAGGRRWTGNLLSSTLPFYMCFRAVIAACI